MNNVTAKEFDLNEYVLNYLEHTHSFVRRLPSGKLTPLFTRDISDRLIFTPDPECEISSYRYTPNSVSVKTKSQCFMPMPWHLNEDEFRASLWRFIDKAADQAKPALLRVYNNYEPIKLDVLHCPFVENTISYEIAKNIINAIEDPNVDEDLLVDAKLKLRRNGIIQIPTIDCYTPTYHQATHREPTEGASVTTLSHGWISPDGVIRKSEIVAND